jgi:tRNA (guanine10-N2)-dimethyltransferase
MGAGGARVIRAYVELSGESPALATAEAIAASEALGGRGSTPDTGAIPGLAAVDLPSDAAVRALADRLALARRCLVERAGADRTDEYLRSEGSAGAPAAFRRLGRPTSGADAGVLAAGRVYSRAGGRIDLDSPQRRFWLVASAGAPDRLLEEVAQVDRRSATSRRMPVLPFQRPVSLPPRFARAAANLARVRPGDRVVDPFAGTGALVAEAALLGASISGVDRDATMVRGALRNLAYLGVSADAWVVGDAGEVELGPPEAPFDALLTDPPYGRASSTGGEGSAAVVARVLPRWAERVRPGGRAVVVLSGSPPDLGSGWREVVRVPVRVHRSLTRQFCVFERDGPATRIRA